METCWRAGLIQDHTAQETRQGRLHVRESLEACLPARWDSVVSRSTIPLEKDVVEILELAGGMEALVVGRAGFVADSLQPTRRVHQACCHAALSLKESIVSPQPHLEDSSQKKSVTLITNSFVETFSPTRRPVKRYVCAVTLRGHGPAARILFVCRHVSC